LLSRLFDERFRRRRITLLVSAAAMALALFAAIVADALPAGALSQAGPLACVSETGSGGDCADGKALNVARSVAVSADGKSVYVASFASDAVSVFERDTATGRLTQPGGAAGCVSETGSDGTCGDGRGLDGPESVAVSPDGASVYVASDISNALAVFRRDSATGRLTQLAGTAGCISQNGSEGACADGKALDAPGSVAVSADGKSVYVASALSSAVAVFARNTTTGRLTQLVGRGGCVSQSGSGGYCARGRALEGAVSVALSANGNSLYVASFVSNAVAVFRRDTTTGRLAQLDAGAGCVSETGSGGSCANGKALDGPRAVALSGDGKSVYVTSSSGGGAVAAFGRNATTGRLTQLAGIAGCVSETGSGGVCTDGRALDGAQALAVGGAGVNVYVASFLSAAVAAFRRDAATGQLSQPAGAAGCVSERSSGAGCTDGKGLAGPSSVAVSADAKSAYVASATSDAVAVLTRNAVTGGLVPLAAGCVSETGSGGDCRDGKGLDGADSVATSADGKNVYAVSALSNAVVAFRRERSSGELTQLGGTAGCVSEDGSGGACKNGKALFDPESVAVSADGKNVYVGSATSHAVAVFRRDATTGELSQLVGMAGCTSDDGTGGACTDGRALAQPHSVVVSADGKTVYVASLENAVAIFARNATSGRLTQLTGTAGCVSDDGTGGCADGTALFGAFTVAASPDGTSVYVASDFGGAVAIFDRDPVTGALTQPAGVEGCVSDDGTGGPSGGACADGRGLKGAASVAVSPDGTRAYVASYVSNAVAVFERDVTGRLTQLGCMGTRIGCTRGRALEGALSVAAGVGGSVYVAASSGSVAVLQRDATSGQLLQLEGPAGCISETGSGGECTDGKALREPRSVVASADGKNVYVASSTSDAVAVFERTP
jgi:DNA-binding beta-propeller fold protein YncE